MKDKDKAQGQLMEELKHLRKRVAELESTDAKRKQADEEVHGKEQLFRALVDRSSDIIVLVNREGKIIYENPVIEQAIGLKPEERLGASVFERIHPDDMKTVTNAFTKLWQDPDAAAQKAEIRLRHKDGKWRTFEATGTNLVHDSAIEAVIVNLRDVTDRKKADEDLRKSEERFRALIESSLDVITVVDAQGTVLYQSPNYASVWGRDPSGEVGKDMFKDVHPDDIPLVGDAFVRLLKNPNEPNQLQVRAQHTDGTWRNLDVVAHNQLENPAVRGIVVTFRDITERKSSEEKFRTLFEGSSNPITVYNRDGNCLMINPKGAKNLGLPVGEIVGKSARAFFPELFEDLVKRFRKVIDQGETLQFEDMVKISTGDAWFWSTLEPVRDATGVPYAVQIISYDITERKRMEQVLRESEERFRLAFDNANTGMCLVGLSGNLMKVNALMSEIFGYSREELERMTVNDITYPEDRDVSPQFMQKAIGGETQSSVFEKRYYSKEGKIVWGQVSSALVRDANREPLYFISQVQDITERKRMEEVILRIGKAVESSSDAIGMSDPQGHHFYHNKAFTNLFEYTPEELEAAGGGPAAFANRNIARKVFDTIMGGGSWSGEVEMLSKSGRKFSVLLCADAIKDESGKVIGLVEAHTDITERKGAEDKLRETRDYMENLIEHANVPMVVWTPDFRITRFNRAFERLTGMKAKAVIGKNLEILFPKETREKSMSYMRTALRGARWEVVEMPVLNVQENVRTVLWNISTIYAEDRKTPIAIIAQGQDITERKQAEEALRESEEMARSMLDNAAMGIYLLQNKKFLYVNPMFEKIMGYTSAELVGQEAINYVHPNDRDMVRTRAVGNLKGVSSLPYEFRVLRKDGQQIWVMERVTSIKYKGRRAVIASFMETTEHRKAEVELERAYEELKTAHERMVQSEKLRAMGEMASGIAHDFNNMLAVILGRTQLVIDDVKDDKVKKGIQIIEQAALDAAKTVKRLQDFARIRVEHAFESLDVNQVVEGVLNMVEPRVVELEQTKGITIKVEHELGKVGQVSGEAAELREALLNILFNAIDAMPTGGKLTVKSEQDEDWVQISIKDTGVGIPDKVKSKVFEPFFTTKASKGSGLGLSVTYGIISRHRGMIKFDSVVGKGTTFYIRLPLAVESVKKETKKGKAVAAKAANILMVDDEPEVLQALGLTLENLGHWVKGVASGAEAIKAFKDGNYDLVITDLGMPVMSGWDVARAIKKIKPDMPVLMITGWVVELDEEQKKIVDGVISKPFSRDSITSAINQVFPAKKRTRKKKSE